MRAIARRNGRPAHELFEGRTTATVPMSEWRKRHKPIDYQEPGIFARLLTVSREKLARSLARGER